MLLSWKSVIDVDISPFVFNPELESEDSMLCVVSVVSYKQILDHLGMLSYSGCR